jgi:hypothetical protein
VRATEALRAYLSGWNTDSDARAGCGTAPCQRPRPATEAVLRIPRPGRLDQRRRRHQACSGRCHVVGWVSI